MDQADLMKMQIHSLPAGDVLKHRHKVREIEVSPVTAVNEAELVHASLSGI